MHEHLPLRNLALLILAAPALASAANFNVRPGAWESTTTSVVSGNLVPAAELAKMPPEQRARVEAMLGAHAGAPRRITEKSCISQADLDQDRLMKSDAEQHCTTNVVSRSPTRLVLDRQCPQPHASTAHVAFEAPSPERFTGSVDVTLADGGKVHLDIQGRWLGASCAGLGPATK